MKVTRLRQKATDECITEVIEYSSLSDFYDYIMNTPYNKTFENHSHSSVTGSKEFTKTYSFDEAVSLFKNGWVDMSAKLTQRLNVADKNLRSNRRPKTILSVQGYQAVVPLYLNGCPQNMVNSKMVSVKQKIESQGYRCNLNIVLGVFKGTRRFIDAGGKYHDTEFYKACKEASEGKGLDKDTINTFTMTGHSRYHKALQEVKKRVAKSTLYF